MTFRGRFTGVVLGGFGAFVAAGGFGFIRFALARL